MSGYDGEGAAIRERFRDAWTFTPVAWPNKEFSPPDGAPWVRLSILPGGANEAGLSIGDLRRYRHDGLVTVQVFVPANTGDGVAQDLAERACKVFRGQTFGGVRCEAPYVTVNGDDGAGWYGLTVWVPYLRDTLFQT